MLCLEYLWTYVTIRQWRRSWSHPYTYIKFYDNFQHMTEQEISFTAQEFSSLRLSIRDMGTNRILSPVGEQRTAGEFAYRLSLKSFNSIVTDRPSVLTM